MESEVTRGANSYNTVLFEFKLKKVLLNTHTYTAMFKSLLYSKDSDSS